MRLCWFMVPLHHSSHRSGLDIVSKPSNTSRLMCPIFYFKSSAWTLELIPIWLSQTKDDERGTIVTISLVVARKWWSCTVLWKRLKTAVVTVLWPKTAWLCQKFCTTVSQYMCCCDLRLPNSQWKCNMKWCICQGDKVLKPKYHGALSL